MKILLTILLSIILSEIFAQDERVIIGKGYSATEDSISDKVYISIMNDLEVTIRGISLTHDMQRILTIETLKNGTKKCYSFLKRDLKGNRVFILQYGMLTDTVRATDDISYTIHELEITSHRKPLTQKQTKELKKLETRQERNEDSLFKSRECIYRLRKL